MGCAGAARGFLVVDGVALVVGAAVSSIHVLRTGRVDVVPAAWVLVWVVFVLVALTSAGPFLFVGRKFALNQPGYPRVGDRLWGLLGLPWVVTAIMRSCVLGGDERESPLFVLMLTVGLGVVGVLAFLIVWSRWVVVSSEQAAWAEGGFWTSRVGLLLSIAWPLQFGLGLVVLS